MGYIVKKGCRGCFYWQPIGRRGHACHYLIETGRPRPCEAGYACTVRVEDDEKMRRLLSLRRFILGL